MACFLIPATEAIVVTVAAQIVKSREKKAVTLNDSFAGSTIDAMEETKTAVSKKLMLLANLLWGGVLLLAYEHLWHGEVVPWFPFLTAASDPADAAEMLHEMSTVGVTMAILVTAVWGVIMLVTNASAKKAEAEAVAA